MIDEDFNKDRIVDDTCRAVFDSNLGAVVLDETELAVIWAVDATLRYVVEWLQSTGHSAKAEILERLSEL